MKYWMARKLYEHDDDSKLPYASTRVVIADEAQAEIDERGYSKWINVEHKLPESKQYTSVLVTICNDENTWVSADQFDGYTMTFENGYCPKNSFRVTHWMALPNPPEKK